MPFFKWKAYDFNLKYYDGVMESSQFEMVVLELHTRGLAASGVEEIEYGEYIASKAGDTHITKWKQKLKQFNKVPANKPKPKAHTSRLKSIILCSIIALVVLVILILNPQCPRRL